MFDSASFVNLATATIIPASSAIWHRLPAQLSAWQHDLRLHHYRILAGVVVPHRRVQGLWGKQEKRKSEQTESDSTEDLFGYGFFRFSVINPTWGLGWFSWKAYSRAGR